MASDPGPDNKCFYLNMETKVACWELPEGVSESAVRYVMHMSQDKKPFYVDNVTGESIWQLPTTVPPTASTVPASAVPPAKTQGSAAQTASSQAQTQSVASPVSTSTKRKGFLGLAKRLNARNLAKSTQPEDSEQKQPNSQQHQTSSQVGIAATSQVDTMSSDTNAPPRPPPPPPRRPPPPPPTPSPAQRAAKSAAAGENDKKSPNEHTVEQKPESVAPRDRGSDVSVAVETTSPNIQQQEQQEQEQKQQQSTAASERRAQHRNVASVFRPQLSGEFRQLRENGNAADTVLLLDPKTGEPTARFQPGAPRPRSAFSDALLEHLGPNTTRITVGSSSHWARGLWPNTKVDAAAQTENEIFEDLPDPKGILEEKTLLQSLHDQIRVVEAMSAAQVVEFMSVMAEERHKLKSEKEHLERLHGLRLQQLLELGTQVQRKHQEATKLMKDVQQRENAVIDQHVRTQEMLEDRERDLETREHDLEIRARRLEAAQTRLQKEYEKRERNLEQEHLKMEKRYDELQAEMMRAYSGARTTNTTPGRRLHPPSIHYNSRPSSARRSRKSDSESLRSGFQFGSARYDIDPSALSPTASQKSAPHHTHSTTSSVSSSHNNKAFLEVVTSQSPRSVDDVGWRSDDASENDHHSQAKDERRAQRSDFHEEFEHHSTNGRMGIFETVDRLTSHHTEDHDLHDDASVPSTQPEGSVYSVNSVLDISELVESSREQSRRSSPNRAQHTVTQRRGRRSAGDTGRQQGQPTPTAVIDLQSLVQQTKVN